MTADSFAHTPGRLAVDVWFDVMCPYCYTGDTVLRRSIQAFDHGDAVDVRHHSFQLMPDLSEQPISVDQLNAEKQGVSAAESRAKYAPIAARARTEGLDLRFDLMQIVNTRRAHQLVHIASARGKEPEMVERLFRAHFTDGLNVADLDVLAELAAQVGLDRADARAALAAGDGTSAIASDLQLARDLGLTSAPFFVFGGKLAFSGAQPAAAFDQALRQAWDEATVRPPGAAAR